MRIIVGDTETAGLKKAIPPATGVAQVAWVEIQLCETEGVYKIVEENVHVVDPGMPIDPKASEIHGLYDIDVAGKPNLWDVFKLEGPVFFIAHNRPFDYPRLAEGMENCVGGLCTLAAARRLCEGPENNKLTTLIEYYGLPVEKAHDALGDVRMTVSFLNHLLKMTGKSLKELTEEVATVKVPTEMPFGTHKGKQFRDIPSNYIVFMLGQTDLDEGVRTAFEMQRRLRGNGI